jgi:GNAT superfamily N-acetyltransferase
MDKAPTTHQGFSIRPARPEDREAFLHLVRACYYNNDLAEGREDMARMRANELASVSPGSHAFIAEADGRPVAFAFVTQDTKRPGFLVDDLHTLKDYEGRGIASALLKSCEQFAKDEGARDIHLNVIASHTPVVDFYSKRNWLKQSFDDAGVRTDIDPKLPRVQTHLMQKNLTAPA